MTEGGESPPRGRPRRAGVCEAVFDAFLDLVSEQGYAATSMDQVAERAGVAKTTIYRRWPSRDALIVDAHRSLVEEHPLPDTGGIEGDLLALSGRMIAALADSRTARVLQASVGEMLSNPALAEVFRGEILAPRLRRVSDLFERAATRGEVPGGQDWQALAEVLIGANVFRIAVLGNPPDREANARLVRQVVAWARSGEPTASHRERFEARRAKFERGSRR